jgi:hypothetical protein
MSASSLLARTSVLSGLRRLHRAKRVAFASDPLAIRQSSIALKAEYVKNMHVTDPIQLEELIKGVKEVEDMLLNGIIQGKVVEDENKKATVKVKIRKEHGQKMDKEEVNTIEHLGDEGEEKGKDMESMVLDKPRKV